MSGFKVEFSVLNLKATPGIYADAFANRPAAGYPGRVFIDTDNPSTGIYRDTGTVWVQIAETATSDVDTLQNVTDNGNTTTNSISVGHANTPVATIDVRQSTSGLNNASNWTITANNNPTIASGATFGTNYVNAIYGAQTQLFLQNATIGNSGLNTAGLFINTLQSNAPGSPGIITVTQASTIRAISGAQTGIYYGGTNVGVTYSHVAALKTFQPINTGSAATVTNNYGIIVADSTPSSGTVTYTNRWGIYQEGASDKNYFAANVLIKSTTDNGNALQVTGQANFTGNVAIGTTISGFVLDVLSSTTTIAKFTGATNAYVDFTDGTVNTRLQNSGGLLFGTTTNHDLTLRTNAATRLTITNTGNVGVGIVPTAYLGFVSTGAVISLHTSSTSGAAGLNFYENGSGRFSLRTLNGTAGLSFFDSFNGAERARIDASGNLLVGGTSVYGATITSYGSATRSGGLGIRNSAGTAAGFFGTYAAGSGSGSTDISV